MDYKKPMKETTRKLSAARDRIAAARLAAAAGIVATVQGPYTRKNKGERK